MTAIENLRELMAKATPLPWTAEFLGGRELGEQGIMAGLESQSSPFCRSDHREDEAFTAAAVNALPDLLAVVEAAQMHESVRNRSAGWEEYEASRKVLSEALAKLTKPKEG